MHKAISVIIGGVMLLLALSPFSYAADAYPSFGPQTYDVHKYYYFGDSSFSSTARQGIDISVDAYSVSYQSVKATVTIDYNMIMDRYITKFIVLANGVNVDEFEPYLDTSVTPPVYKEYYYLDVNVSDQYIGSDVYFQVVALSQDMNVTTQNVYVVGWSQESPTVHLKPLPVTDSDTHGLINESNSLLQQILNKLEELKSALLAKLDQLNDSIKKIYEVTPETQAKFDASLANLQDKLPTKQAQDQIDTISNLMTDSASRIENAPNELKFGEVTYMNVITVPLLDFTEVQSSVEKLRNFIAITIWITFFIFVIRILTPKLTA